MKFDTKEEINDSNTEALMNQGKTVNNKSAGVVYSPLTINASTQNVSTEISNFVTDKQKISVLTITGELSNLEVLNGVEAQSVDLSGLTNESITGLKLPTTTGEIKLPGGTTYANNSVTNTTGVSLSMLSQELKVLKDNGKTISSVALPGGGTWDNGTLTLSSTAEDANFAEICKALTDAGLTVSNVTFSTGTNLTNGTLTLSSTTEDSKFADTYQALTDAGLTVSNVTFSTGTKLANGTLTVVAADDTAAGIKAKADALKGKGLTISTVVLPNKTTWNDNKMTTKSDVESEQNADKAKLVAAGFPVDEVIVSRVSGEYVMEVGGVTVLTLPEGKHLSDVWSEMTDQEKAALKETTSLKLVGNFNSSDFSNYLYDSGKVNGNLEYLDMSSAVIESSQKLERWKTSLKTLYLPTDPNYTEVPAGFFQNSMLESLQIPSNITSIGKEAFQGCTNLATVEFVEPCHVEIIGESAFERSGISGTFVIPSSVKRIEGKAFKGVLNISTIIIPEDSQLEYIGSQAFVMDEATKKNKLKNVYVNVNREIQCELDAFDFYNTDNQTQFGTVQTRLHYPPELYDFYVGQYKKNINGGYITSQGHLMDLRNGAANGWQRFVSSGLPVTKDSEWRTYSDIVPIAVPGTIVFDNSTLEVEVFLVTDYVGDRAKLVKMRIGDVIPANTGIVIHYDIPPSYEAKGVVVYFPEVNDENKSSFNEYKDTPYNNAENPGNLYLGKYRNYLMPLNTRGKTVKILNVEFLNPDNEVEGEETYRNFFFGNGDQLKEAFKPGGSGEKYKGIDWDSRHDIVSGWGFFRSKSGDYAVNSKAYLHYPATLYTDWNGAEMDNDHTEGASEAKGSIGFFIVDTDDNDITSIKEVTTSKDVDDSYYTLQGIKVPAPTKSGIYIHNGKKVIVK